MPDGMLFALTMAAALGCGLMAGVFFAFSAFIMKALARLPDVIGIAAMQSINVVVINPLFLGVFFGTATACALAMLAALIHWEKPSAAFLFAGGACYLVGTFLVTILCNVPLNNSLAAIAPANPDSARQWAGYTRRWTAWNHVRTVAALAAMGSFVFVLRH